MQITVSVVLSHKGGMCVLFWSKRFKRAYSMMVIFYMVSYGLCP